MLFLQIIGILGVIGIIALLILLLQLKASLSRLEGNRVEELIHSRTEALEKSQTHLESRLREELERNRDGVAQQMKGVTDSLLGRMADLSTLQKNQLETYAKQLETLTRNNEERQDKLRDAVEKRLVHLQEDNAKRLEQMRQTVDEKLHATLEKRLGESFKLVSERLEQVHKGLGEMQTLATGVGDLKKVLTNVKTRGTWGEVQLGALLEQILTLEQYEKNVITRPTSRDFVEYAVKLPGKSDGKDGQVWLPIDAKFPQDVYHYLIEAQDRGDALLIEEATKQLDQKIKLDAKTMSEKYIEPPYTTDFAILFLPTEGLYAEVLRRPGLAEHLQQEFRILVAGPTTLAALLNSLQMGFRTLAIEKKSSDVWRTLGAIKYEFGKFGDLLEKTKKKLQESSNVIDLAARKSRTIERKLRDVEVLPGTEALLLEVEDEDLETTVALDSKSTLFD